MCEKKIEENAQIALEQGDVLKLAGVIYLSKELGYESRYIKQLKESASTNETAMEAENTVREFELDEQALFGSEEVQKFNSGGVAMAMAKETDD